MFICLFPTTQSDKKIQKPKKERRKNEEPMGQQSISELIHTLWEFQKCNGRKPIQRSDTKKKLKNKCLETSQNLANVI